MTDSDRIDATTAMLERAAREAGFWLSGDGRCGEADVAELLGFTAASLAKRRTEGAAPTHYRIGGRGHRVSYSLRDVARWLEAHRSEPVASATDHDEPEQNTIADPADSVNAVSR